MDAARSQAVRGGRGEGAPGDLRPRGQLGDVQRIMMQNIDDVLQRGTVLSGLLPFFFTNSRVSLRYSLLMQTI